MFESNRNTDKRHDFLFSQPQGEWDWRIGINIPILIDFLFLKHKTRIPTFANFPPNLLSNTFSQIRAHAFIRSQDEFKLFTDPHQCTKHFGLAVLKNRTEKFVWKKRWIEFLSAFDLLFAWGVVFLANIVGNVFIVEISIVNNWSIVVVDGGVVRFQGPLLEGRF